MDSQIVYFSGFESKALEDKIEALGGKVRKTLTKNTTLIVYDPKDGVEAITKDTLEARLAKPKPVVVVEAPPAPKVVARPPSGSKDVRPASGPKLRMQNEVVVFSGFRSEDMAARIVEQGGKIEKTFVKATTILVYDAAKAGSKVNEARQRGIKIYTKEQFEEVLKGKKVAPPPPSAVAPVYVKVKNPRLPKVWKYDADKTDLNKFYKKIQKQAQPGDVVMPEEFYRGQGTCLVGRDLSQDYGMTLRNGEIVMPPWVMEMGLKHGFTESELISVYEDTSFTLMVYPKELQGSDLQIKNGIITSLRVYNFEQGEEEVIDEEDDLYYHDFDETLTPAIFV